MSSFQSMWKHENLSSLRQYTIHIIHNKNIKNLHFCTRAKMKFEKIWYMMFCFYFLVACSRKYFVLFILKCWLGNAQFSCVMKYQTGWFIKFFFTIVDYIVFFWRDKCAKLIRWQIEIILDKKFIVFVVTLVII